MKNIRILIAPLVSSNSSYDKQPNTIQPFELRVKSHFENSDINLDDIAPIVIPESPPWLNPKPIFNLELTQYKKYETNPFC